MEWEQQGRNQQVRNHQGRNHQGRNHQGRNDEEGPEPEPNGCGSLQPHHKPNLHRFLRFLGLDVTYYRALGSRLFTIDASGGECEVLDLVGGYGALLFGHNHPTLLSEAERHRATLRPHFVQGARSEVAEQLAAELSRRCGGDYNVVFGNSGAEAVEIALKHAMLETGGQTFVTLAGAFHGKTLAALQLCGNDRFRVGFSLASPRAAPVPAGDHQALRAAFRSVDDLAGMIVEPILGEGGVRELSAEFMQLAEAECRARGVPLIVDECQTGLGRTGHFLACQHQGVKPDYVLLSKALGGGLAKVSATLIERERYCAEFDFAHSGTFSGDEFSCVIALRALRMLDETTLRKIARQGRGVKDELSRLIESFPKTLAQVRGRGLMLGIEFRQRMESNSLLLRGLASRQLLLPCVAAYLFHQHQIRVAPTLTDPMTLRLQPPITTDDTQWTRFYTALEDVCALLECEDTIELTRFLLHRPEPKPYTQPLQMGRRWFPFNGPRFEKQLAVAESSRVAWICHLVDGEDLARHDPSFRQLDSETREEYVWRSSPMACPVPLSTIPIQSRAGRSVQLIPIMLPVTSRTMRRWMQSGDLQFIRQLVHNAVEVARSLNCKMVALGQYTSIVTRNAATLTDVPIGLTTGNAYTIGLTIQALRERLAEQNLDSRRLRLAVVGATGNIGSVLAERLGADYLETLCFTSARRPSRRRLHRIVQNLPRGRVARQLSELRSVDIVVVAVNTAQAIIDAELLKENAIVCDVSVPSAVARDVTWRRPDVTVIRGGIVQLPNAEDLEIPSFPLPRGQTFACMAEGVLMGLEGRVDKDLTGSLSSSQIDEVFGIAEKHGFKLVASPAGASHWKERQGVVDAGRQ